MSFRIPAPSLTNKLLPPCFRKHLSYDTVCRQQNIPLEVSFGVSMIFYKVKSWFLWKAWWVLVVYDIAHFQNDNEYSWKNEFYFANPVPPNVCFPWQRLDSERHEKYQHHSWEQKAQKQKAKMKCKKMCTILFLSYIPSARGIRPHTVPIEAAASLNSRRMRVWNHQTTRARSRRRQAIWTR
jgi:hypothetical protein